jgi:hypothetical protein
MVPGISQEEEREALALFDTKPFPFAFYVWAGIVAIVGGFLVAGLYALSLPVVLPQ